MKGAFEEVIRSCTTYNNGGIPLPLTPQQEASSLQEEKRMGSLGLRGQCGTQPSSELACNLDGGLWWCRVLGHWGHCQDDRQACSR